MAIKKCRECGQDVSDKAEACPTCGAPTHFINHWAKWAKTGFMLGTLFFLVRMIWQYADTGQFSGAAFGLFFFCLAGFVGARLAE